MEQGVIPQHIAGSVASFFVWQVLQVACNTRLTAVKYEVRFVQHFCHIQGHL